MRGLWVVFLGLLIVAGGAGAEAAGDIDQSGSVQDGTLANIDAALKQVNPDLKAVHVSQSPIPGMMGVQLSNDQYVYVSQDGRYVFSGRLYEQSKKGVRDLTEAKLQIARKETLRSADLSKAITFWSTAENPSEIYVFTDVTCPYCERLQQSMAAINEAGITVHYFAFPRAGADSKAAAIMSRAWCSSDAQAALGQAFKKESITEGTVPCVSPVAEQYQLGKRLGVSGTPGIYDASGRHLGGYLTVDQLKAALGRDKIAQTD